MDICNTQLQAEVQHTPPHLLEALADGITPTPQPTPKMVGKSGLMPTVPSMAAVNLLAYVDVYIRIYVIYQQLS